MLPVIYIHVYESAQPLKGPPQCYMFMHRKYEVHVDECL